MASVCFFLSVELKNTVVTSIVGATPLIDAKVPEVLPMVNFYHYGKIINRGEGNTNNVLVSL